jgi:hypothetical protein
MNTSFNVSIGKNIQTIGEFAFAQNSLVSPMIKGSPTIESHAFWLSINDLKKIIFVNPVRLHHAVFRLTDSSDHTPLSRPIPRKYGHHPAETYNKRKIQQREL